MAMNNALLRTARCFFARHIACRSFVTENLNKIEDLNKRGICISDDAKDSKITVWWDVQACKVPIECEAGNVIRNIRDELRGIRCNGPVEFWGYGDMTLLPSHTLSDLHNGGVRLRHVPFGSELQDQVMIGDMIEWTKDHPPPAIHMIMYEVQEYYRHICLFKEALDVFWAQGYGILLVQPVEESDLKESKPGAKFKFPNPDVAWRWGTFLAGPGHA